MTYSSDDRANTVVLNSGGVEYSLEEAAMPIDELIELLQNAKSEGAEWVVQSSGNYRGAQWQRLPHMYGWMEDDD